MRWLCILSVLPLFLLSDFVIDLHHVWSEVHTTVLVIELEEWYELLHEVADFLRGQVIVLEQHASESAKCLRLEQVEPCYRPKLGEMVHDRV